MITAPTRYYALINSAIGVAIRTKVWALARTALRECRRVPHPESRITRYSQYCSGRELTVKRTSTGILSLSDGAARSCGHRLGSLRRRWYRPFHVRSFPKPTKGRTSRRGGGSTAVRMWSCAQPVGSSVIRRRSSSVFLAICCLWPQLREEIIVIELRAGSRLACTPVPRYYSTASHLVGERKVRKEKTGAVVSNLICLLILSYEFWIAKECILEMFWLIIKLTRPDLVEAGFIYSVQKCIWLG